MDRGLVVWVLGAAMTPAAAFAGPVVTLVAPADELLVQTANVTFTCSASDARGLLSATLLVGKEPQTVILSGPSVTADARLVSDKPDANLGSATTIKAGGVPDAHAVIKFSTLIGNGPGQVPPGTHVISANLELNCTNRGDLLKVYRLTEDWNEEEVSWNRRKSGVPWTRPGADGSGSNAGIALDGDFTDVGLRGIDITRFVEEWCNGAPNYGLVLAGSSDDGVYFGASEGAASPILTVIHQVPFSAVETRSLSGTSATVTFTTTLADLQTHAWNCLVKSASGLENLAPADFRLTVDTQTPNAPVIVAPASGAAGQALSSTLAAEVSDPNGNPLNVAFYGREAVLESDFTIIPLPDTQVYAESYPEIFTHQTRWIVDNVATRNIAFVTHEGDIVNVWNSTIQWERANTSLSLLDGVVPYGIGPGNHDQPTNYYNLYFPYTRYQDQPWYGGHYGHTNDNNYQIFSASGVDFIILHIEFCPPAGVLAWADSVLKAYPERTAIITTHGFLGASGERSVHICEDTQYIWDALVAPNSNIWFILCGHVHFEFRRTDIANGHAVHQILADYQTLANGGSGWLRIMRFSPSANKVFVETYSPWLDQYQTDANSQFELEFPMRKFTYLGTAANVPSGSQASLAWQGLSPNTSYEWYVLVTDSTGRAMEGPFWRFSTGGGRANTPPVAHDQSVSAAEGTAVAITLTASDDDDDPLSYVVVQSPARGFLSGAAPNLIYQPQAGYTGGDRFAFKADDGQAFSNTAAVSISITAGLPEVTSVAFDDFESGSFSGGRGWLSSWTGSGETALRTADNPYSGTYHVRLRSSTGDLERGVDLSGMTGARLKFWARVDSFEGSDKAFVKVSPDGGRYTTVKALTATDSDSLYHFHEIDLSSFPMTAQFRIAFDAQMSSTSDYLFIDDVEITVPRQPPQPFPWVAEPGPSSSLNRIGEPKLPQTRLEEAVRRW